jgi:uncharacterized membrane protein
MTEEERMRGAWEVYLYARDLLGKRMSYGMIAQSMLLIAFSTLASGRVCEDRFVAFFQIIVAALGLTYTLYQYFRVLSIQKTLKTIEDRYFVGKDLVFSEYLSMTRSQHLPRNMSQLAMIVIFLFTWILFLFGAVLIDPGRL